MSVFEKYRPYFLRAAFILVCLLLVLLPYHAFLSVWVGSSFGVYRYVQLWKEAVVALTFCLVLLSFSKHALQEYVRENRWLLGAGTGYVLLTLIFGLMTYAKGAVNTDALAFAFIINIRYLLFFLTTHMLFSQYRPPVKWLRLIVIPAIPVVLFGLVQQFLLPPRFLEHFGYSMYTILPFQYVDNNPEYLRVQSFLRGANPLGAYLVIVLSALMYYLAIVRSWRSRVATVACTILVCATLYYTYSRSAWLGVLAACLVLLAVIARRTTIKHKKVLIAAFFTVSFIVVIGGIAFVQNNPDSQYAIFHSKSTSDSRPTSNSVRAAFMRQGLQNISKHPFGTGPGTAGPASVHNTRQEPRIPENYFMQIALETGLQGLLLFMVVYIWVGNALWRRRADGLALVLFVSLIGITVVNMVSHAWADDTLSLIWWGLAGIAMAIPVASGASKTHAARPRLRRLPPIMKQSVMMERKERDRH